MEPDIPACHTTKPLYAEAMRRRRFRVFRTFFLEQALLCLAGTGAGALAFRLFTGVFTFWREIALFAGCYLLGCALAISALNRTSVLQMLGERE